MILFYIRHGNPTYVPDELTPLGRRQAEAVARRLGTFGIDEVYSSSSIRAMQTAQPTCEITKNELHTLDWLHEGHAAKQMMIPYKDGKKSWIWSHPDFARILCSKEVRDMGDKWYEHPSIKEYDLGAAVKRVGDELDALIASFGYEHDREKGLYRITSDAYKDKRVAIFAHEGVGKVFMSELLDIPYPCYATHFEMQQSGITAIKFDDGGVRHDYGGYARARVMTLSNDSHLYRDGLPTEHYSTYLVERY